MTPALDWLTSAFHRPGTRIYAVVQGTVGALIALSILLFAVEWAVEDSPWVGVVDAIDRVVLWIFAVEITLRIATWRPPELDFFRLSPTDRLRAHLFGRLRYCLQPLNLIDLVTVAAVVPALRGLRALRLLRLLRSQRLFRYANPFSGIIQSFRDNGALYAFALSALLATLLLGGVSMFLIERGRNPGIASISDGIWWTIVTLTTVGYGDITPVTVVGRVVAGFLMISGMFFLALFAGIVGHTMLHAVLSVREEQFRMSAILDHIVICGYEPGSRLLLDALREEIDPERRTVVLMAPGDRPADVPPEFMWVTGDPTKESELDKVRLTHAAAAILVGSRHLLPQQADAITILTAFTLRSYLARQPMNARRGEPLYVAAEILDAENVAHARAAGVDEVIETTRLGFSLLTHAVTQHGTAEFMSQVARVGAHSLYVGRVPAMEGAVTFQALSEHVKAGSGALVIGLRDADTGEDRVNPPDSTVVGAAHHVIYLATGPVLEAV